MKKRNKIILIGLVILLVAFKCYQMIILDSKEDETLKEITSENICVALNYHRVKKPKIWFKSIEAITNSKELSKYNVYEDDFKKQMTMLKEQGAYFATLDEMIKFREEGNFPEKCVWISFDDVDKSVYENAFPILKEMNIPFTLFVIAGQVGNNDFNNLQMATWDDLREMKDSGLASFGSHSYDMHYLEDDKAVFLEETKYTEFKEDIIKSKEVIENNLQVEVKAIAYPFGETSDEITNIAKEAGFEEAFILSSLPITPNSDPYYQNRYLIDNVAFDQVIIPWIENN